MQVMVRLNLNKYKSKMAILVHFCLTLICAVSLPLCSVLDVALSLMVVLCIDKMS